MNGVKPSDFEPGTAAFVFKDWVGRTGIAFRYQILDVKSKQSIDDRTYASVVSQKYTDMPDYWENHGVNGYPAAVGGRILGGDDNMYKQGFGGDAIGMYPEESWGLYYEGGPAGSSATLGKKGFVKPRETGEMTFGDITTSVCPTPRIIRFVPAPREGGEL